MKHFDMITLERVHALQSALRDHTVAHRARVEITDKELGDLLRFASDHLELLTKVKDDDVFELTQIRAGDIVTDATVAAVGNLFAMHENDTYTKAEDFQCAREQVLRDIGGQQLVDTVAREDLRGADLAIQRAMESYYKSLRDRDDKIKKESN